MDKDEIAAVNHRLDSLEAKVDMLVASFNRATGALLFVKLLGGFAVGLSLIMTFFADIFHRH